MTHDAAREGSGLVSIIIPVHNGAATLGETLDSLYSQSYANLEIIVIDDASVDDTQTVLNAHHDPRFDEVFCRVAAV